MDIISVQSRVTWGYVGNAIAVPVLQTLGTNVWPVDTVRLSHHPGHGPVQRQVTNTAEVASLLEDVIKMTSRPITVLMGYLGSAEQGQAVIDFVTKQRADGNDIPLFLDTAFGDDPGGTYVDPEIIDLYQKVAIEHASFVMPNRYELATLTGLDIASPSDAVNAARTLVAMGCGGVVASSIPARDGHLCNVLVGNQMAWECSAEELTVNAKGTGDLLSAAYTGLVASGHPWESAFSLASAITKAACEDSAEKGLIELDLVGLLPKLRGGLGPITPNPIQ